MRLMATTAATALLLSMGAAPVWAHHSFSMFDRSRTETLSGTVKELEIINPHSWLSLVVVDGGGRASEWSMEAGGWAGGRNGQVPDRDGRPPRRVQSDRQLNN